MSTERVTPVYYINKYSLLLLLPIIIILNNSTTFAARNRPSSSQLLDNSHSFFNFWSDDQNVPAASTFWHLVPHLNDTFRALLLISPSLTFKYIFHHLLDFKNVIHISVCRIFQPYSATTFCTISINLCIAFLWQFSSSSRQNLLPKRLPHFDLQLVAFHQ